MIATERLILRAWRDDDLVPFHAMGQDPEVMRYLGPPLSREAVAVQIARQNALIDETGHCFWALERREDGAFLGFCGVKLGPPGTPIAGQLEIGWRLARSFWGQGYAREAAQASLNWVWANLEATEVAAMTVPGNSASWGLMERLGMTRMVEEDFDHPALAEGDPLRRHIVYRIARP
ncbi:GNAT family N-acetyltransferase [Sphingomonas alpina]|uniref:GNAT family N-acetyltransferase n=1 Tax=Sphingomonas alpina TaxID=653931 RepID=A0A7H0LP00_9SPHN|nr:GNAT family N-acetyltransferase [Sphingomonas alpina]QNQ11403.1 GNAT family N-acetyltransferase [Sphingomonas alpina]